MIHFEFILFGITLLGVAIFHRHTLLVSALGFLCISIHKLAFTGFKTGAGWNGFLAHLSHEWVLLANLLCLLTGFALLARHFEKSQLPMLLPKYLPDDWKGGFVLLAIVFVLSSFLDNIAGALIGGAMAHQLYKAKVHIGFLAAIVAAANAGGSGSVVGDTTTTMMWIAGVSPMQVLHAYVAAMTALMIFGIIAARQQQAYSPIIKSTHGQVHLDLKHLYIVFMLLFSALGVNFYINAYQPEMADLFPWIGIALWFAIIATTSIRRHDWEMLPETIKGSLFLLLLVLCASMMPVENLPAASWQNTILIGFVSAFFDNIPLTALAIRQGGYDWGVLAFAVGFGGSMLWFGSSAGVALTTMFPEARSTKQWLKQGWHIVVAYIVGIAVLLAVLGWHPQIPHRDTVVPEVKAKP